MDSVNFPEAIVAAAADAQATLGPKLAELAAIRLPLLAGAGPAEAERWIEAGPSAPEQDRFSILSAPAGSIGSGDPPEVSGNPPEVPGELVGLSVAAMRAGFRTGRFDPVDVTEATLARMDAIDGELHAVVTRVDDRARAAAAESTRRWRTGTARPLEGVPVAIKDIIETAGVATRAGSALFTDHVPMISASVVDRLERAGAVLVAKTTTPELAFGDESGDGTVNPWAADRWTGGSSSGSAAALAAGMVPAALGTDTGGSIRVPASYCGVSGIKPTFGRVPRTGVFPVSWTLDHAGPMARTAEDLGLLLAVLAGADPADPYSSTRPVPDYTASLSVSNGTGTGLRVGVPGGWLAQGCSPGVIAARDAALDTLAGLGAEIISVPAPHAELAATIAWLVTVVEFAANHDIRLGQVENFTPSAAHRLVAGARISARDYLRALRARRLVQQDFDAIFEQVDIVVTPATPTAAPDVATFFDDGDRLWLDKVARNFLVFNVTGMPALVVPSGLDGGLPTAIQIAARPHRDDLCLAVGAAFQRVTDHHQQMPSR